MGYMGFGMRKEVYQRKPKKFSVNYRYKKNKKDKLKPEQKDFSPSKISNSFDCKDYPGAYL